MRQKAFNSGGTTVLRGIFRGFLALVVLTLLVAIVPSPASAQLVVGCTCPAGSVPIGPAICSAIGVGRFPATCRANFNQSFNHIAASDQQLSFFGVEQILQGRRDQLQGTLGRQRTTPTITGYSE